jgi:hypothetical protein
VPLGPGIWTRHIVARFEGKRRPGKLFDDKAAINHTELIAALQKIRPWRAAVAIGRLQVYRARRERRKLWQKKLLF